MNTQYTYQKSLNSLKKKYPNAKNIVYGNNNMINGFWFENGENAKLRTFYPLNCKS